MISKLLFDSTQVYSLLFIPRYVAEDMSLFGYEALVFPETLPSLASQKGMYIDKNTLVNEISYSGNELIFGNILKSLLTSLDLVQIKTEYIPPPPEDPAMFLYYRFSYRLVGDPVSNTVDGYKITVTPFVAEDLVASHFKDTRARRNELLREVDYLEFAGIPQSLYSKLTAYKQLLRDCVNVVKYPHEVVFPTKPNFNCNSENPLVLTEEQVEGIKDIKCPNNIKRDWYNFLLEWEKYNFTPDVKFIMNIATLFDVNMLISKYMSANNNN